MRKHKEPRADQTAIMNRSIYNNGLTAIRTLHADSRAHVRTEIVPFLLTARLVPEAVLFFLSESKPAGVTNGALVLKQQAGNENPSLHVGDSGETCTFHITLDLLPPLDLSGVGGKNRQRAFHPTTKPWEQPSSLALPFGTQCFMYLVAYYCVYVIFGSIGQCLGVFQRRFPFIPSNG